MNRVFHAAALGVVLASWQVRAEIILTASSWVPPTHTLALSQGKWCEEVARATSGRVKCNILPKPVSAPSSTFDSVRDGLADISFGVPGYTPGRYVFTQIAELPFSGDSAESMSVAYQRIHERHFAKFNEHKGLKVIAVFTHGPGNVYNTKHPINTVADLQGLKFRVGGGIVNDIGKALGANVTVKPATESYELLSSGVMDGVLFPAETIASFKLDKVIKYATLFPGGLYNTSFALVMNEDTWKRIPKADQDIVAKLSGEHAARLFGRGWDEVDKRGNEAMVAAKVQVLTASKALIEAVKAKTSLVDDKWFADAKTKGLANPQQVLEELRAEIRKH